MMRIFLARRRLIEDLDLKLILKRMVERIRLSRRRRMIKREERMGEKR